MGLIAQEVQQSYPDAV
ncbi:hypothetical protein [Arthrospira platensis]